MPGFPDPLQFRGPPIGPHASSAPMSEPSAFAPRINRTHYERYDGLPIHFDNATPDSFPLIPHDAEPGEDLEEHYYPHTKSFRMWEAADVREYEGVMKKVGLGHVVIRYEDPRYVEAQMNWIILLGWFDVIMELPKNGPVTYGTRETKNKVSDSGSVVHR